MVHRIIAVGDYVWAHVNFLNLFNDDPEDTGIAGVDIYKMDADGKAIEHWDTNPNGMFRARESAMSGSLAISVGRRLATASYKLVDQGCTELGQQCAFHRDGRLTGPALDPKCRRIPSDKLAYPTDLPFGWQAEASGAKVSELQQPAGWQRPVESFQVRPSAP
jgi:hypothetical protein